MDLNQAVWVQIPFLQHPICVPSLVYASISSIVKWAWCLRVIMRIELVYVKHLELNTHIRSSK